MLEKIENVYLIGLGAMGCLYASRLFDYNPQCIHIILDAERKERYQKEGVFVNGKKYDFSYVTPDQAEVLPKADLVIVGVKMNQLEDAVDSITPFIQSSTRIISILNGISSETIIAKKIGIAHLLYAYGVGMDAVREGTQVHYSQFGWVVFGEKNNAQVSNDVLLIQQLFDNANIPYQTPENMELALWKKFMLNVAANQVSAVLKVNYGVIKQNKYVRNLMYAAAKEVLDIAKKCNIGLTDQDWNTVLNPMDKLADNNYTSMCQDILAGRKTEVVMFGETVVAMGKEQKIETPVNQILVEMIHAHEETAHIFPIA